MYIRISIRYIHIYNQERLAGAVVPAGLLDGLLKELEALKWPANTHRYKVQNPPGLLVQQKISDPERKQLSSSACTSLLGPPRSKTRLKDRCFDQRCSKVR